MIVTGFSSIFTFYATYAYFISGISMPIESLLLEILWFLFFAGYAVMMIFSGSQLSCKVHAHK